MFGQTYSLTRWYTQLSMYFLVCYNQRQFCWLLRFLTSCSHFSCVALLERLMCVAI
jgi:hypothetical protein